MSKQKDPVKIIKPKGVMHHELTTLQHFNIAVPWERTRAVIHDRNVRAAFEKITEKIIHNYFDPNCSKPHVDVSNYLPGYVTPVESDALDPQYVPLLEQWIGDMAHAGYDVYHGEEEWEVFYIRARQTGIPPKKKKKKNKKKRKTKVVDLEEEDEDVCEFRERQKSN